MTANEERRNRIMSWARCIVEYLESDSPDIIIGQAIHGLYFAALADKGIAEFMMRTFTQRLTDDARQRCGYCQSCDNKIAIHKTHFPLCGTCDGKANADFLKWEMENTEEEADDDPQTQPE